MRKVGKTSYGALGVLAAVLWSGQAPAQTDLNNGIKVGEARLHPFFDLELRYDSAAVLAANKAGVSSLAPEAITHLRPGLRLAMPSRSMALNLSAEVDYLLYTGLLSSTSVGYSHLQAGLDFDVAFNRTGPVEFQLGDHLSRSNQTSNAAVSVGVLSFYNELRAAVPIHPGGGALEVTPKGAWAIEYFEPMSTASVPGCGDVTCQVSSLAGMNYSNFRVGLDARWRFLPKTAVVFDSTFETRAYADPTANSAPLLLKATLGLSGLVAPKIATVFKVGWGNDFSASGAKTLIGGLELTYLMSETSSIRAGYLRTLDPVPSYRVNGDDRAYADARMLVSGKLTLHGYAAFDYLSFYGRARNDALISLTLGPDYQITSWLIASLGYTLSVRASTQSAKSANVVRHEVYGGFEFTY